MAEFHSTRSSPMDLHPSASTGKKADPTNCRVDRLNRPPSPSPWLVPPFFVVSYEFGISAFQLEVLLSLITVSSATSLRLLLNPLSRCGAHRTFFPS